MTVVGTAGPARAALSGSEYGTVSCLSVSVCVATTDKGFWVTSDDGGLRG